MFSFYQTGEYIKKRCIVELTLIPKIKFKIDKLNEQQMTTEIANDINHNELILESLKYYYNM